MFTIHAHNETALFETLPEAREWAIRETTEYGYDAVIISPQGNKISRYRNGKEI